jgi:hypothetical protein
MVATQKPIQCDDFDAAALALLSNSVNCQVLNVPLVTQATE